MGEALIETNSGVKSESISCCGNIGTCSEDIAGANREKFWSYAFADDFIEEVDKFENGVVFAIGNVEDVVFYAPSRSGEDVGLYDVIDKGEVAGLFAGAEDGWLLVV